MRPVLVVMVKEPRPGRVKSRLGQSIGMVPAAWWFRHQAQRLLRNIEDPRWQVVLAVSPDHDGMQSRVWPVHHPRIPQGRGDLGGRMARIMTSLPSGPVCIIGADIPGIRRVHIANAFASLGQNEAVFGPAPDGGYWLVGLKRLRIPPRLFQNVRWSGPHAMSDSIASLEGLSVGFVDTLQDIDTVEDLGR